MSSQLGNTANPLSGWDEPGTGYAFATEFTTPAGAGIVITNVHAYFDLATGSGTGYVAVWNYSTGALICSASVGSLNVKTGGVGDALDWWTAAVTPTYVAGGTNIWIGGYTTGSLLVNSESGGSSYVKSMGGSLGAFTSPVSSGIGGAGAYVDYNNAGGYVNTGTAASPVWTAAAFYINTGTAASPSGPSQSSDVNTGTLASPVWTAG